MNFLAPLFLAGAAAVALPVLFHLIRRSTRERTLFSSLLLLQPTPPRMRRRSRLEDILLLLLRCAVLGLLALGFARPFLRDPSITPPAASTAQRVVVLVDTSASMQRAGLWKAALEQAEKTARSLAHGDHLALFAFDRETRPLISFEAWHATPADQRPALVAATLGDVRPGWSATQLAHALIHAAESLAERSEDPATLIRRIILISDLQEGARLDALQAYDWPRGITVHTDRLTPSSRPGNSSLHLLIDPAPNPGATSTVVRVRVQSAPDSATERLELGWLAADATATTPTFASRAESLTLAPGVSRVLPLTVPTNTPVDRISLRGDSEPFDNTVYVVPPIPINTRILYAGDDAPDDPRQPLYFLRRAFPATNANASASAATLTARRTSEPFSAGDAASAVIIATSGLPPALAGNLHKAALDGATVLFAPRTADPLTSATLGTLLARDPVRLEEVQPRSYAMLAELDFRHSLLAAFANPKFSDFTKVHFWRHRRLDTNALATARVIARFDSGDPAWIEFPAGRGRVFVFTAGWHPDDSQLALSTKFVPLLFALLESTGATPAQAPRAYIVGDTIPLPEPATPQSRLRLPDGTEVAVAPGATNIARTDLPGIYTLALTESASPLRFAVNLDPTESRTLPLAVEDLERLGVAFRESPTDSRPSPERAAELAAAEVESRQKLWRWFILATLAFVFLESALAGWITRRSAPLTAAAAAA